MFVSDRLIYLELHKTGCTHIRRLLTKCVPGKLAGKHNRPGKRALESGKRFVGSIRNPWDWYVSLWAFGCRGEGGLYAAVRSRNFARQLAVLACKRRALGILGCRPQRLVTCAANEITKPTKIWRRTYSNKDAPALFREWLRMMLDQTRKFDFFREGYAFSPISTFAGLLTYRYTWLFSAEVRRIHGRSCPANLEELREFDEGNNLLDFTIRNESLEDDLIDVLSRVGYELGQDQSRVTCSAGRSNVSRHRPSAFYYDSETIDLVTRMERFVIDKYDYKPPGFALPTAVHQTGTVAGPEAG